MAFFIQSDKILGLKGDGRGFSSSSDPSQSRVFVHVDSENQSAKVTINPSCTTGGQCYEPVSNHRVNVTFDGSGGFNLSVHAHNSVAPSAPATDANLSFTPDGKGSFTVSGSRDGFPSAEAYSWNWGQAQTIFQSGEKTPFHLFPFMPNVRF